MRYQQRQIFTVFLFFLNLYGAVNISAQPNDTLYSVYVPQKQKSLGIWTSQENSSLVFQKYFKQRMGFSSIMVSPFDSLWMLSDINFVNAIAAGFERENVWILTPRYNYEWVKNNIDPYKYYIDEPVEHDCFGNPTAAGLTNVYTPDELKTIYDTVHSSNHETVFAISGYKRCSHLKAAVHNTDLIFYSSYDEWNDSGIPLCFISYGWGDDIESFWIKDSDDQWNSWKDMKKIFGDKFTKTWVKAGEKDFHRLFETADDLELNEIFLYAFETTDTSKISTFCRVAFNYGWLKKSYYGFLSPPDSFQVIENFNNQVKLKWLYETRFETGFVIERSENNPDNFLLLDTTGQDVTSFTDSTVLQSKTYYYRIKTINEYIESNNSDTISVTTPAIVINSPDELKAEIINSVIVKLTWNDNSNNELGFIVERKKDESEFQILDSTSADTYEYIDSSIVAGGTYHYRIKAYNDYSESSYSDTSSVTITTTGIETESKNNFSFKVFQNYPNPFNSSTVIEFEIEINENVKLELYNSLGELTYTVYNNFLPEGHHTIEINLSSFSSGVYLYHLCAGQHSFIGKLVYLK